MKIKKKIRDFVYAHVSTKKRAVLAKKWGKVNIGENCEIYPNVIFGSEPYLISIGNNVRITSGVKFCTHDGGMWVIRNLGYNTHADCFGKIVVGDNVHIGWNAIIMPNVEIGSNVIVGAGAVVTHNIPDNTVVAGVPARVIRTIDEYYKKNSERIVNTKGLSCKEKKVFIERMFDL